MIEKEKQSYGFRAGALLVLAFALLMGYQNCGSDFALKDGLTTDSASTTEQSISCELDAFKATYAVFLTKCAACHVPGGVGKDAFAGSDASLAYSEFLLATPALINQRAVLASHAPGVTGPANQAALDTASNGWTTAIAACDAGVGATPTPVPGAPAATSAKNLTAPPTTQTLVIALDNDVVSGAKITGATLTLTVQSTLQADGNYLYTISKPTVTTKAVGVHMATIMLNFNGTDLALVTTFSRLDKTIAANQTGVVLSTAAGAYEAPGPAAGTSNTLALKFSTLQAQ